MKIVGTRLEMISRSHSLPTCVPFSNQKGSSSLERTTSICAELVWCGSQTRNCLNYFRALKIPNKLTGQKVHESCHPITCSGAQARRKNKEWVGQKCKIAFYHLQIEFVVLYVSGSSFGKITFLSTRALVPLWSCYKLRDFVERFPLAHFEDNN